MTRLGIKAYQAIILSARFILFLMSGHLCQILALFYYLFLQVCLFYAVSLQIGEKHAANFPNRNQEFRSGHSHTWIASGGLKHALLVKYGTSGKFDTENQRVVENTHSNIITTIHTHSSTSLTT